MTTIAHPSTWVPVRYLDALDNEEDE